MVEHLKRHGAEVDAIRIEKVAHSAIADRLQAEAHALGAAEHLFPQPRMAKSTGDDHIGVTHDLIARMSLPIFMSH
jgi:hypothetical protein